MAIRSIDWKFPALTVGALALAACGAGGGSSGATGGSGGNGSLSLAPSNSHAQRFASGGFRKMKDAASPAGSRFSAQSHA